MFDQMFVDRASIGDIVCELSKHYKQLVCYVYDPKTIISIRHEISSIGISETSFTGGLMP